MASPTVLHTVYKFFTKVKFKRDGSCFRLVDRDPVVYCHTAVSYLTCWPAPGLVECVTNPTPASLESWGSPQTPANPIRPQVQRRITQNIGILNFCFFAKIHSLKPTCTNEQFSYSFNVSSLVQNYVFWHRFMIKNFFLLVYISIKDLPFTGQIELCERKILET